MAEEMWRKIQAGMGYTDEEMALAMQDPYRRKVLEAGPVMVRRKIVGEVIEAKNCAAHKAGAKYIVRGNGVIRAEDCTGNMCLSLLAAMNPVCQVIFDRLAQGQDPRGEFVYYVHCPDTGVRCGGFGEAVLKITVE